MRREIVYQYDLPVEILDDISEDEEVLNVLFGRSKEKYLIPVLFSDKRIFWGYPETKNVYRVFEQQYIDISSVYAKFPPAGSASLSLKTVNGQTIFFPNIQEKIENVRGALLTAAEQLKIRSGTLWSISQRKTLLTEECLLHENPEILQTADAELFEDEIIQQTETTQADEELFSHFSSENEDEENDVFEIDDEEPKENSHAMEDRISRLIQSTEPKPEKTKASPVENDVIIYETAGSAGNEQWNGEGGGDAEILPRGKPWRNMQKVPASGKPEREVFSPEDDDSEVYVGSSRPKLVVPSPKADTLPVVYDEGETQILSAKKTASQKEEAAFVEKITVLPNSSIKPKSALKTAEKTPEPVEPVMIFRRQKNPEAVTLQPKEGIDDETVDKSLEALKFLRENKIISEAEYKKRCLSLFEEKE